MSVLQLARPELLGRSGYTAALGRFDVTRLHANELPSLDDDDSGLNRYPPPRPVTLTARLAEILGVHTDCLLVTRGSNEGIDLLVRAFCRSGIDSIITCSPTFGMYRVCAEVQGAGVLDVALDADFDLDVDAVTAAVSQSDRTAKVVFLCSPANPTGAHLSPERVERLCHNLKDKAIVVLDQAYIEFCDNGILAEWCNRFGNLAVLRTFSKAYGLAGLRCGILVANPAITGLLDSLLAPYSTPTPTIDGVLDALSPRGLERSSRRLKEIAIQKSRLKAFLDQSPLVERVYPSDSNFFLIQSPRAQELYDHLLSRDILVRSFINTDRLNNGLRITVGNRSENASLIDAFEEFNDDP